MISLGLVGCGAVVHSNYAPTLLGRDGYAVRYVCDTDSAQAASAAAMFDAQVVSLETLADNADAVIISTPPSTHSALVRACLRPRRAILCEKPYMTTYVDAAEVSELARECEARLYVGCFRRLFPQLVLARELVALGVIGEVTRFSASEGGRFTWKAVSSYTTRDSTGGVLWDTGAHTVDMALFASGIDEQPAMEIEQIRVTRDKPEPSHDFQADFQIVADDRRIEGHIHVSRKEALPNIVRIVGTRGDLGFVTGMDDRVRLTTETGSAVLHAGLSYVDLLECFDLQLRHVLTGNNAERFEAKNFIGQIKLMEALANAQ
jgi:predicted dehydrogenase